MSSGQVKVKRDKPQNNAPLNAIDNAFLLFEEDYHPMTIGNIWEMDRKLTYEQVVEGHKPLMARDEYRRYRQTPEGNVELAWTKWVDVPNFDIRDHIYEHNLPAPGTKKELEDLVSRIFTGILDRKKPLWECHLINGAENGHSRLVYRLHHALTDGQGSIRALLSVTSADDDLTKLQYSAGKRQNRRNSLTQTVAKKVKKHGKQLLMLPGIIIWLLVYSVILTWFYIKFFFRPRTSFYRDPFNMNPVKRVGWSEQISLDDVKMVKNVYGGTVNDVLVSCVSGALRAHLIDTKQGVQELFCAIPVSMRDPKDFSLRNLSTMVYMELPTTVADPVKRMRAVHERTDAMKKSPAAYINHYFGNFFYGMPLFTYFVNGFFKIPKRFIASRCQAVLTNVPGPQQAITFAGSEILSYAPFIPQHGAGCLGMGVVSYNGKVQFGLVTEDDFLEGGPDDIARRFNEEFAALVERAKADKAAMEKSDGAGEDKKTM